MEFDIKGQNSAVEYFCKDVGYVAIRIHELMDSKGISINRMAQRSGIQHRIVKKYYEQRIARFDLEMLAKFCFVLECDIADILYYRLPDEGKG